MAAIRVCLLGPTWAFDMQQQIHRLRQGDSRSFTVESIKAYLAPTPFFLGDEALRTVLSGAPKNSGLAIASYNDWVIGVKALDADRVQEKLERTSELQQQQKSKPSLLQHMNTPRVYTANGTPSSSSSTIRRFPDQLTNDERRILREHLSCYSCQQYYAGHMHDGCPRGKDNPLTNAECPTINENTAVVAKARHDRSASSSLSKGKEHAIASAVTKRELSVLPSATEDYVRSAALDDSPDSGSNQAYYE
ncbi:hypothetical protein OF83DRAFT_1089259, partial [Amylostereum chailletii]